MGIDGHGKGVGVGGGKRGGGEDIKDIWTLEEPAVPEFCRWFIGLGKLLVSACKVPRGIIPTKAILR